ncbi:MAG: DUF4012 domain-containing protein, partial [bacterium]|nr:DUF4012 domain-containing protein [bacterium]
MEQEGAPISFVSAVYLQKKNNKLKRITTAQTVVRTLDVSDAVKDKDVAMLQTMKRAKESKEPKRVPIRFEPHESSTYVLAMERAADATSRETEKEFVDDSESTIDAWMAPYEPTVNLEHLFMEAKDLQVGEIDPRIFQEQFTPADAWVAYQEQFGFWPKLRKPFLRWEEEQNTAPRVFKPSFWARFKKDVGSVEKKAVEEVHKLEEEREELVAQIEQAWQVPVMVPKIHVTRVMIGFLALLLLISLPAGAVSLSRSFGASVASVKNNSVLALSDIKIAASTQGDAQTKALRQASSRFRAADDALNGVNVLAIAVAKALPETRDLYDSAHHLLAAGEKAAVAASVLSQGVQRAFSIPVRHSDERLSAFITYTAEAKPLLDEAAAELDQVKTASLPPEMVAQVETMRQALALGQESLRDFQGIGQLLLAMAGHDGMRSYLFVFQNHTELRPTGGFMGSIAQVDMDRGDIKRIWVPGGGPYDLRNQLKVRVSPPAPLQLLRDRWEFEDANWFPDFPTSAEKINWFWSKSGQPTLDGVIAVNATIMEKLLLITGPIEMPEYGKTITAENFLLET